MSLHKDPKYQIPALIAALLQHGLKHDTPSQLADGFRTGWFAALAAAPAKSEDKTTIQEALSALKSAMSDDPEYAWSWHCNICMPIVDCGAASHKDANIAAARIMRSLFDVDMENSTRYVEWTARHTAPAQPTHHPETGEPYGTETPHWDIMCAAYDFRDAHLSGDVGAQQVAYASLVEVVRESLAAAPAQAVPVQAGWCDGCSPDNCGGCVTPAAPAKAPLSGYGEHIAVPRSLIGAVCSAIDNKRVAPKVLAELRRYTTGDLSAAMAAQQGDSK